MKQKARPVNPDRNPAPTREGARWLAALLAAALGAALTAATVDQLRSETDLPAELAAVTGLWALLWWLPALGVALRRRWGLNLGIGTALATLLFALAGLLLGEPPTAAEAAVIGGAAAAAAGFLALALRLRRRW